MKRIQWLFAVFFMILAGTACGAGEAGDDLREHTGEPHRGTHFWC